MSKTLHELIQHVQAIAKQPFDWDELDELIIELHSKLTEPKWAIEDEVLRSEVEKMIIQWAVHSYLAESTPVIETNKPKGTEA